jgi:hypothetical protein
MPPSRRGTSRAQGCTNTGVFLPQLPPIMGVPYTTPVGLSYMPTMVSPEGEDGVVADPLTAGTDDRLRAAATMDYVSAQVR